MSESPDVRAAMRLLDAAKAQGFWFERIAPGPDGPLRGVRETARFADVLYIGGMWAPNSCTATRRRRSGLILPGGPPVIDQITGNAITVLHTVVTSWPPT
ncbi:MAG TPA: hypothetical protein VFO16_14750 [Pseudonocardiaceae bacterium]|nr:hypothetical protein [Pseudonocardiaceae bacterium]